MVASGESAIESRVVMAGADQRGKRVVITWMGLKGMIGRWHDTAGGGGNRSGERTGGGFTEEDGSMVGSNPSNECR